MLYPLTFHPIFKERVWGGQKIRQLYSKPVPQGRRIGESWEISDHGNDVSVIANGPLAGKNLRWLMENHRDELLGTARDQNGRFPLLIKILDAQDTLSLQVHPPASVAAKLGGEPKTEMWFVADAAPGAEIFVGIKQKTSRDEFEKKIRDGSIADCFHRISVKTGDAMFLPSGRVHAVGAGLVLFEIQQNADTTYRVFDWNRAGLDGKPRELHVTEALASIDFNDFEPSLIQSEVSSGPNFQSRCLVENPLFTVGAFKTETRDTVLFRRRRMNIFGVTEGKITVAGVPGGSALTLQAGEFCLVPACLEAVELWPEPKSAFLRIEAGE